MFKVFFLIDKVSKLVLLWGCFITFGNWDIRMKKKSWLKNVPVSMFCRINVKGRILVWSQFYIEWIHKSQIHGKFATKSQKQHNDRANPWHEFVKYWRAEREGHWGLWDREVGELVIGVILELCTQETISNDIRITIHQSKIILKKSTIPWQ